jgi:predicted transcriptional regulator
MIDRTKLKDKIPHGYGKIIAKKAGVTAKAVSEYLNNRMNSERIELAALNVVAELENAKNEIVNQIQW